MAGASDVDSVTNRYPRAPNLLQLPVTPLDRRMTCHAVRQTRHDIGDEVPTARGARIGRPGLCLYDEWRRDSSATADNARIRNLAPIFDFDRSEHRAADVDPSSVVTSGRS